MTGKEKCKLLKTIRQEIAESNGIVYLTSECTYEGDCKGTCPKCDAEIRYLDAEIRRLMNEGITITLEGISAETLNKALDDSEDQSIRPLNYDDNDVIPERGNIDYRWTDNELLDGELKEKGTSDEMVTMGAIRIEGHDYRNRKNKGER